MKRNAFVDEPAYAREFSTGDVVRKSDSRDLYLSPYVGRVLWSSPRTGKVQVQWPWGSEQESSIDLVKDTSCDFAAPELIDQSLSTWEGFVHSSGADALDAVWARAKSRRKASVSPDSASRILARYETITMPVWRAACKQWHVGSTETEAFINVSKDMFSQFGSESVRMTVANLYDLGRRLAIYWKDSNRRYRVTQKEKASGVFICPRCKGGMKPRTYRQGQKVLACRSCGFSIHPEDLIHGNSDLTPESAE